MTTAPDVRQDIDANWQGVYAALQAVGRIDERVSRIDERVGKLEKRVGRIEKKVSDLEVEMRAGFQEVLAELKAIRANTTGVG